MQSAITAINSLSCGGDDQHGGSVQCTLLKQVVATVPEADSSALQTIADIEASLTYAQAPAKVILNLITVYNTSIRVSFNFVCMSAINALGAHYSVIM